jgi:high-affinity iron transporter
MIGSISNRKLLVLACGLVALICVGVAVWEATDRTDSAGSAGSSPIVVSGYSCAAGWSLPNSGQRQLSVVNTGSSVVDVTLVGATNSLVYGEIDAMAPGVTRTVTAVIPPGRYRIQCTYSENASVLSSPVTVTGSPVEDAHPYLPVSFGEVEGATATYRNEVSAGLTVLASDTDHLRSLADDGQMTQAKSAWLVAHLDYERLGAAYGTFGDFNDEIDGRPNGLPLGVNDPGWTGFLRLEYGLWHNQPPDSVAEVANVLDDDVHGLVAAFPDQSGMPNDLSLRTHEILENTLQFQLTGESDEGSHTNLATASANVEGTEMTLQAIAPLLDRRDPALLNSATADLHRLSALLNSYQQSDGSWVPVQSLTLSQNQLLDGTIGNYLETVAPIPDILELQPEAQNP